MNEKYWPDKKPESIKQKERAMETMTAEDALRIVEGLESKSNADIGIAILNAWFAGNKSGRDEGRRIWGAK